MIKAIKIYLNQKPQIQKLIIWILNFNKKVWESKCLTYFFYLWFWNAWGNHEYFLQEKNRKYIISIGSSLFTLCEQFYETLDTDFG